jgi:hypothetical protein
MLQIEYMLGNILNTWILYILGTCFAGAFVLTFLQILANTLNGTLRVIDDFLKKTNNRFLGKDTSELSLALATISVMGFFAFMILFVIVSLFA